MGLWGLIAGAWAQTVISSETFDAYDQASFSGTAGWVSQYASDPWSAAGTTGVRCTTDDEGGTYGSHGPADNALVYTSRDYTDLQLDVETHMLDDDGIGVVFGYQDMANTYLLVMGGGARVPGPGTGAPISFSGTKLYRIEAGVATELATDTTTFWTPRYQDLRVIVRDDQVEVWFDDDDNGSLENPADRVFQVTAPTRPEGQLGLYCYNAADLGCEFERLTVSALDTDGDGILDPDDACLFVNGASQTDTDGDGLGDDCEDDDDGDGVEDGADCAPLDGAVFPGAAEACDGVDQDCDDAVDDGLSFGPWAPDVDLDGFGDAALAEERCDPPVGWIEDDTDCDDADDAVHPGAEEVCNGVDDDCANGVDDGLVAAWWPDGDGDGVGAGAGQEQCGDPGPGWAPVGGDCDDTDPSVLAGEVRFPDEDGDGFGDPAGAEAFCDDPPAGFVTDGTDCDDGDATVFPGAPEVAGDGVDQDCDDADDTAVVSLPKDEGCGCGTAVVPAPAWLALAGLLARRRR